MTATKFFSLEDISKNNGKNGAKTWLIIKNNVYDVTNYLDKHPGGPELLSDYAGKDATKAFEEFGHSGAADDDMKAFKIGEVCEEDRKKPQANKKKGHVQAVKTENGKKLITRITCGLLR